MPPASFIATVTARRVLSGDYFEITLRPTTAFHFEPGHFVTIEIPSEPPVFRAYSIASAPRPDGSFDLCVKRDRGVDDAGQPWEGRGSGYLFRLAVGDTVTFRGPSGVISLDPADTSDLLLAGTGTGIAPLRAIVEQLTASASPRSVRLFFGVRYESDIFYAEEFAALASRNSHFHFTIAVSRPPETGTTYATGRLPEILQKEFAAGLSSDLTAFVCGGRAASHGIRDALVSLGLPLERIHLEAY